MTLPIDIAVELSQENRNGIYQLKAARVPSCEETLLTSTLGKCGQFGGETSGTDHSRPGSTND
jgi:hypothetical protein